jgi:hypothetical protein
MKNIEPGVYTINILKPGYETESTEEIVIGEGDATDLGNTILLPELQSPALADEKIMWIMLFVLAIAVVALILIIILYRRKKKKVSRDL